MELEVTSSGDSWPAQTRPLLVTRGVELGVSCAPAGGGGVEIRKMTTPPSLTASGTSDRGRQFESLHQAWLSVCMVC